MEYIIYLKCTQQVNVVVFMEILIFGNILRKKLHEKSPQITVNFFRYPWTPTTSEMLLARCSPWELRERKEKTGRNMKGDKVGLGTTYPIGISLSHKYNEFLARKPECHRNSTQSTKAFLSKIICEENIMNAKQTCRHRRWSFKTSPTEEFYEPTFWHIAV